MIIRPWKLIEGESPVAVLIKFLHRIRRRPLGLFIHCNETVIVLIKMSEMVLRAREFLLRDHPITVSVEAFDKIPRGRSLPMAGAGNRGGCPG